MKKSLINPERVKNYLMTQETGKPHSANNQAPKINFKHVTGQLSEDLEWKLMMEYLKENPAALLDALPTPPGEEEEANALADFKSGLTP